MFENNEDSQCMSGVKVFLCLTWFMMNVRPRVILGQTHQRGDKTDCSGYRRTCIAICSNMQPSVGSERRNINTGNTDFLGQQAGQPSEHYIPWLLSTGYQQSVVERRSVAMWLNLVKDTGGSEQWREVGGRGDNGINEQR